ncbi:MAG TPA: pyruvate kinase [Acetobacteraceae bacterium]|nr:pyruvate kinase [Acetobacteraceae bacterium]
MAQSGRELLAAIDDLRRSVAAQAEERAACWREQIELDAFLPSAANLAQYLALRRRDLRNLQRDLARHGLSSLGRLESRVLITLEAVQNALAATLSGAAAADWPPSTEAFFRGEAQLQANAGTLLGGSAESGRILVTLGAEAAQESGYMLEIARRGADAVRINCAHDHPDTWAAMIENTHRAGDAVGRRIRVLMDLGGPKFRIGEVRRQTGERLHEDDRFRLVVDVSAFVGDAMLEAVCEPGDVLERLTLGTDVVFDDGKLAGVVEARGRGSVQIRVTRAQRKGFKMKPERGLTFPRADLKLDPLTEDDLSDLDFVARHADLIGFSFVQSPDDIARLQNELASRRPDWRRLGIIAKVETAQAVTHLPDIIVRAAGRQPFGVMIARGDLAVALGFERLAEMQEEILWLCESAHVPVIWATQVLEALVKSGLPTRGEMTDAAMAGRAECVMLNKGPNVGEAITALRGLLQRMAEHQSKKTSRLRALRSW